MAKVVNNFIKGRMNKDLDDRLIPIGEYRNAINAQVSKSEGQNVGALENVLGNSEVAIFQFVVSVALVVQHIFAGACLFCLQHILAKVI